MTSRLSLTLGAALFACPAFAQVTVDGSIGGDSYGAALSVQAVQTQFGDNFSEWNAAYGTIDSGRLYLALTGNLEPNFNKLEIFIDSTAGGENVFSGTPGNDGAGAMTGLTFDAGFDADYHIIVRRGFFGTDIFDVDIAILGTPNFSFHGDIFGGANFGSGTTGTGPGNASPLEVAYDGSNVAGIIGGCDPADAAAAMAVTTGFEISIDLADLGSPAGDIRVLAFQNNDAHNFSANQFLGPLAPPQCNLGGDGNGNFTGGLNFDLNNFAGDQFFTVMPPAGCTSNDDCVCAEAIAGNGTFNFDNSAATTDGPPDALCNKFGTSQITNDVWFAWTPDASCDYAISTCNQTAMDSKIAIYDGDDCGNLVAIDCNDDAASGLCGLTSEVFAGGLTSGTTYLIRIGNFPGALGGTGTFTISKSNCGADNNDDCADCEEISGNGTFNFDNSFATTDGLPDPLCNKFGTSQIDNDVWYCWTAPCNGDYTVSTCNMTAVDTKIAIYDGDDCASSAIIDCNDDAASGLCGLTSEVFGSGLVGGESYLIRIGTFPGATGGTGTFSISGPDAGGTNYCVGGVNQDGEMASIGFNGTPSVSDNNFELVTNGVSSLSRFGLYVMGANQDQVPFAQGFLCIALDNTFNRLNPILQYSNVDQVTRVVDLTAPPADVITGGSTWNFQLWYRDTGETNLSDAVSVCFAP